MDTEEVLFEENEGEEDEVQLTPAQVIELMEEAWVNEKFSPEILPNKAEVVDCLLEQISHMERNLEGLESTNLKKGVHQIEVDRLRFLISSYLRSRLEKIETFAFHILEKEEERIASNEEPYLTSDELAFARSYKESIEQQFDNLVGFYPTLDEWRKQPIVPNLHSFVFLKSKAEVEGVVIDDGSGEGDLVDLNAGSQMIISYQSVADLVKKGDVHLI